MSEVLISTERIPDRLKLVQVHGPLTIMVPDFADPCGMRKIARTVAAAYPANGWDAENSRFTRGRWEIFFAGAYVYPMILVTLGEYRYPITSVAAGDSGGPCELCRAHTHQDPAPSA